MAQESFKIIGIDHPIDLSTSREFYYRIQVDEGTIKYLCYRPQDGPEQSLFADVDGSCLVNKTVPFGDWSMGLLVHHPGGKYILTSCLTRNKLASLPDTNWWAARIDWTALQGMRRGDYEVQCKTDLSRSIVCKNPFGPGDAIVHFDWHPEICDRARRISHVHKHIQGLKIGPRFLAFVLENGGDRVIGCMVEKIHSRPATTNNEDLEACLATLDKLHSIHFYYGGNFRPDSFMIQANGTALLHDFGASQLIFGHSDTGRWNEMNDAEATLRRGTKTESHTVNATNELLSKFFMGGLAQNEGTCKQILEKLVQGELTVIDNSQRREPMDSVDLVHRVNILD